MPTWDLLDESFANLDDWTNADAGNGISEISPAGELRLDGNTASATTFARQLQDIGSFPDSFTFQVKIYFDSLGVYGSDDHFLCVCCQADERLQAMFDTGSGLQINDTGSGLTTVGTSLVKSGGSAEYQIYRFNVTFGTLGAGVCDIYLFDTTHNYEKVGSDIPCSKEGPGTDGYVHLTQYGQTTNDMLTHVDYAKALTGHYAVYPDDLAICLDTSHVIQDGIRMDRASNGDVRAQILYDSDRKDFMLVHKAISEADKAILDAFYATNKALEFTLPWIDDVGYNCIFAPRPIKYTPLGGSQYNAEVSMVQKDT